MNRIINFLAIVLVLGHLYCYPTSIQGKPQYNPVEQPKTPLVWDYEHFNCTMWYWEQINNIISKHEDFAVVKHGEDLQILIYGETVMYFNPKDPCNFKFEKQIHLKK